MDPDDLIKELAHQYFSSGEIAAYSTFSLLPFLTPRFSELLDNGSLFELSDSTRRPQKRKKVSSHRDKKIDRSGKDKTTCLEIVPGEYLSLDLPVLSAAERNTGFAHVWCSFIHTFASYIDVINHQRRQKSATSSCSHGCTELNSIEGAMKDGSVDGSGEEVNRKKRSNFLTLFTDLECNVPKSIGMAMEGGGVCRLHEDCNARSSFGDAMNHVSVNRSHELNRLRRLNFFRNTFLTTANDASQQPFNFSMERESSSQVSSALHVTEGQMPRQPRTWIEPRFMDIHSVDFVPTAVAPLPNSEQLPRQYPCRPAPFDHLSQG